MCLKSWKIVLGSPEMGGVTEQPRRMAGKHGRGLGLLFCPCRCNSIWKVSRDRSVY